MVMEGPGCLEAIRYVVEEQGDPMAVFVADVL
jgi:hypothetical protein